MESFCMLTIKPEKVYDICHDLSTFMDVRPCQNHDFRNSKFCLRQEGNPGINEISLVIGIKVFFEL